MEADVETTKANRRSGVAVKGAKDKAGWID